ncbi:MAG: hypothetical protein QGI78_06875, partial [Phycisphaerales bacterium]|nr:hypothetical protein [Phycisphaerales bacterium]
MFSTIFTRTLQFKRSIRLFVAALITAMVGFSSAHAQLLENEIHSPLRVTESKSVILDSGLVEMQVDDSLLQDLAKRKGEILVKDFPVNDHETVDLVVKQFFPYKGDIHEAYYTTDSSGNRVVRKRQIDITAKCFRGHVAGYPESTVVFGMNKEMCNGFIEYSDTRHVISTDPATQVIVVSDPLAEQPGLQLVREMMRETVAKKTRNQGGEQLLGDDRGVGETPPAGCAQISLSVVYGADFLALFAGDQQAAYNYIITLVGQVSEVYRGNGIIWVEPVVSTIFDGTGSVDDDALPQVLCDFVETSIGTTIPDVTATGTGVSDGYLILRTGAEGAINFQGAQTTKQSLGYFGGLTAGINPAAGNPPPGPPDQGCPSGSNVNAVGAASGLLGATDTTGYDTYIVAQALGTLCGATPTGSFGNITALVFNPLAGVALPGVAAGLAFDSCDTGNAGVGTIMSSCMLPGGATMATNIDSRFATSNVVAMNAFLAAAPLVTGGTLVPVPIVDVAATNGGGAANCAAITVTWTPDPAATAEYVFRNTQNVFSPGQVGGATLVAMLPGGTGTYTDTLVVGGQQYYYWVASTNACNINEPFLIADQYNPNIMQPPPALPNTPGRGVTGTIGNNPPPIEQVMATVYTDCDTITVTWDLSLPNPGGYPSPNPDRAIIWRSADDHFNNAVQLAEVAITPATFDDTTVPEQDVAYYYWVTPRDSACDPPDPPIVGGSAAGILQPNIALDTIRAGATNGSHCDGVEISWIADSTLLGPPVSVPFYAGDAYEIWRQGPLDVAALQIGSVPATTNGVPNTTFLDGSAEPGVEYEYWVLGQNECSTSMMSLIGAFGTTGELEIPAGVSVTETDTDNPDTTPSCGDLLISWDTVAHADEYEVWRSDSNDFYDDQNPPTSLGLTTDLSFVDTPPVWGQVFYYWVASVSRHCPDGGNISSSVFGAALPPLVQPTNLIVSKGEYCDRIHISWDGAFDGTTYTVSRSTTDDFSGAVEIGSIDDLGYFDDPQHGDGSQPDPVAGVNYYYWVVADNECGTTSESDSDSGSLGVQLAAPDGLDATSGTYCGGIQITWNRRVLANTYRIYRDINNDPGNAEMIAEVAPGISTYNDTTATVGVPYYYWVEAVNICSAGEPPVLQAVAAEGLNGSLLGPGGMLASDGEDCGFVEISWTEIDLANNYVVWRNTGDDFTTAVPIGNTNSGSFTDNGVVEDTPYYYWVTADSDWCVGANESASVLGSALPELPVVTGIDAGQGTECVGVMVTWDVLTNVVDYDIYRNETGVEPTPGGLDPDDTPVGTVTEALFQDTTAIAGVQYYYWVQAETSCGEGVLNEVATGYLAEALGAPPLVGQEDTQSCTDITIIWEPVFGADDYSVYRGTSDLFSESELLVIGVVDSTYTDGAVVGGQTYYYWVKSRNACGDSVESVSATAENHTLDSALITSASDDQCGTVDLAWSSVLGADEYHIYYSQNPDPQNPTPAVFLGSTTNTVYSDVSALPDTPLYYWVRAVVSLTSGDCVSDWGDYANGIALGPVVIPENLTASIEEHCDQIWLSWDIAGTTDTTYSIYRSETNDPATAGAAIGSTTTTDFIDTTPVQGTEYFYWVTGETSCGVESDFSAEVAGWTEITPVEPTDVVATEAGTSSFCSSVEITWTASETADTYTVWRSTTDINDATLLAETPDLFYSDLTPVPGTTYTYWVTSKNECGESNIGDADSSTGSSGELTPPTDVSATDATANCGQVDLSWTAVDLATGYFVYRSDDANFANAVLIGVADGPSYTDYQPAIYDEPAYYFVSSVTDACQTPSLHSPAEAGTSRPPLTIPTDILASLGTDCGEVQVTWTETPNAQLYSIYRNETGVAPTPGGGEPDDTPIGSTQLPPYVDTTTVGDTEYYYWVRATNSCGDSNLSLAAMGLGAVPIATSPTAYATQGSICDAIEITWEELPTATLYYIYRNTVDNASTASVISQQVLGTNTWQDTTAIPGETYYYWVSAENGCGESPIAGDGSVGTTAQTTPPATVDATDGDCGVITVTWSDSEGASSYDIYRNQTNNFGTATLVGSTGELTFDDTTAFPLIPYYYWVTSTAPGCNASVASTSTLGSYTQNVEVPMNVAATNLSICNDILVSWSHPGAGTTFTVSRNTVDDFATSSPISQGAPDLSYLDTPPLPNTQYFYWVEANNSCGDSDPSDSVFGEAIGETVAPTNVEATDGSSDLINCSWVEIRWTPVAGADSYNIYRSTTDDFNSAGVSIGSALQDENTYTDATAQGGVTYFYWVVGMNICGESANVSNSDSGYNGLLENPSNVQTFNDPADGVGCGEVLITWDPVVGNTGYRVYRSLDANDLNPWFLGTTSTESYVDTSADPEVSYYYFVATDNNLCVEIPTTSEFGMALPYNSQVQGVVASNMSCDLIQISWAAELWAATYNVYRNTVDDYDTAVLLGSTTLTTLVDTDVIANAEYFYWVTTTHPVCDESIESDVASASASIPVVVNTIATSGLCETIEVDWNNINQQATYHIYRNLIDDPFSATEIGTADGGPYVDTTAVADTTYYYWVTAEPTTCAGREGEFGSSAVGLSVGDLASPLNVFASQGSQCGSVLVQWTVAGYPDTFTIYRADGEAADWADAQPLSGAVVVPPASQYADFTAIPGVTYTYWVVANNACGSSDSSADGVSGFIGELANPVNLVATDDQCGTIILSWDSVPLADTYIVSRAEIDDFTQSTVLAYTGIDPTYVDEGTTPDQQFFYWVQSVSNTCETPAGSSISGVALANIAIADNVAATQGTHCEEIWVSWDSVGIDSDYDVYRSDSNVEGDAVLIGNTDNNTFVDDDVALVEGDTYYYWVTTTNSCGEGPMSLVAAGYSSDTPVGPTEVSATDSGLSAYCDSVFVEWLPAATAAEYVIWRSSTGLLADAEELASTSLTSFDDTNVEPDQVYTYWILTRNACGDSLIGAATSTTGSAGQLAPPSDVSVDAGPCGQVDLSWTPVTNATAYEIYRSLDPYFPGANGLIGMSDGPSYSDFSPSDYDTPLYYFVKSMGAFCQLPDEASVAVEGIASPTLAIPTDTYASVGTICEGIWVNWTETAGATSYDIYRNTTGVEPDPDDPGTYDLTATTDMPPYTDVVGNDTTEYYYWVRATNSCGDSNLSIESRGVAGVEITTSPEAFVTGGSVCDAIEIGWNEVPTASLYYVYRNSEDNASEATELVQIPMGTNVWQDMTAATGQQYYYWVSAENGCGNSDISLIAGTLGWVGQSLPPVNVTATDAACDTVTLTWDAVTNAVEYEIFRNTTDDFLNAVSVGTTGESTFVDTTAVPMIPHYYWVTSATADCPASIASSVAIGSTLQGAEIPSDIVASQSECNEVLVTWTHPGNGVTFRVSRSETDDFDTAGVLDSDFTDQQYVDTTAVASTEYFYWVEAISTNGCDDSLESVSAAGEAIGVLDAPSSVDASDGEACDAVQIQWTPVDHVDNYNIYRSTTDDFNTAGAAIGSVTQDLIVYDDATALSGITYFYWVVGENSCGEGAESADGVSGFTGTLVNPENIVTTQECGAVSLTWDAVLNNNGYQVYRGTDPLTPIVDLGFANTETFIDVTADPKVPYYYFVTTHNGICEGLATVGQYGMALP